MYLTANQCSCNWRLLCRNAFEETFAFSPDMIWDTGSPCAQNAQLSVELVFALTASESPMVCHTLHQILKDEHLGFKDSRICWSLSSSFRSDYLEHWGLAAEKTKWDPLHNQSWGFSGENPRHPSRKISWQQDFFNWGVKIQDQDHSQEKLSRRKHENIFEEWECLGG